MNVLWRKITYFHIIAKDKLRFPTNYTVQKLRFPIKELIKKLRFTEMKILWIEKRMQKSLKQKKSIFLKH